MGGIEDKARARYRCLVTGGAGFIGSHLTEALLTRGYEVICLDNFDSYYDVARKRENVRRFEGVPGFALVEGSVLDPGTLRRSMEGVDYVFHNAARPGVRESMANPAMSLKVNALGTLGVLQEAQASGVAKVIYSSSSSVYGNAESLPAREDQPARPVSPYGIAKLCGEDYCEMFRDIYGLNTICLRYFTVYGPRMRPDLAIATFTSRALAGDDIEIAGDGRKSRDFTCVDDVVDANLRAMGRGEGIFNIGTGRSVTIGELAAMIRDMAGSRSQIVYRESVKGDAEHTLADISKAERCLGYWPGTRLEDGLKRYIRYARESV